MTRARERHAAGQTRSTPRKNPEAEFQSQVVEYARLNGWRLIYHTWNSERSEPGFPDLVLVRGSELVFAELKAQNGRVSQEQLNWNLGLTCVSEAVREAVAVVVSGVPDGAVATPVSARHGLPRVEAHIFRPSDWPEIESTLRRRA